MTQIYIIIFKNKVKLKKVKVMFVLLKSFYIFTPILKTKHYEKPTKKSCI